jgi:hypothetical protein
MVYRLPELENRRLEIQATLDAAKSPADRNRLGQFATPPALALAMMEYAKSLLPTGIKVRFLDPAFGTGAFLSAFLQRFPRASISTAVGFEIDPHFGVPSAQLWRGTPLELRQLDFTSAEPPVDDAKRANLVISNPRMCGTTTSGRWYGGLKVLMQALDHAIGDRYQLPADRRLSRLWALKAALDEETMERKLLRKRREGTHREPSNYPLSLRHNPGVSPHTLPSAFWLAPLFRK